MRLKIRVNGARCGSETVSQQQSTEPPQLQTNITTRDIKVETPGSKAGWALPPDDVDSTVARHGVNGARSQTQAQKRHPER